MGPPQAADNFGQRQEITTTIRSICQYYPSNTCLRELLQNADDAKATEIEYLLDTHTYSDEPLLCDGLKDYQGPALLARNDSVFRDEDFRSLSTVGDSVKVQDPTATGKFGQGFNAVYHWTDGPWVYSRKWLLILDPHEWWSGKTGKAGGPTWDVVKNRDSMEIQNHLKVFEQFGLGQEELLNQTIIRIPLRTPSQAAKSRLFQEVIEVSSIRKALEEFGQEVKEGGLLFLKHIRKVVIRIDGDVVLRVEKLDTNEADTRTREELPSHFKGLYATHPPQVTEDIFSIFQLAIRYSENGLSRDVRYVIQHAMLKSSGDPQMDTWARQYKLFPWVAVAAQLPDQSDHGAEHGRLFTILRLPMPTNLPVHIHGLFSISPDRGRLSFTRGSDDMPTKWNKFIFTQCVALAWVKLLVHRSTMSWRKEMFTYWPRPNFKTSETGELWEFLDDSVIDRAINFNYKMWNAANGSCVDISSGHFAVEDTQARTYGPALAQVKIPAIYLEGPLYEKVRQRAKLLSKELRTLTPTTIRRFLRWETLPHVSDKEASLILEFCLLDAMESPSEGSSRADLYNDLDGIQLWPTVAGTRSISRGNIDLLIPRDDLEMRLFAKSKAETTLDLSKLSPSIRKMLLKDIQYLAAVMRFRGVNDLATDWPTMYSIPYTNNPTTNPITRDPASDNMLCDIWAWIANRVQQKSTANRSALSNLWLVPLNGRHIRSYVPAPDNPPVLIIEPQDNLHQILVEMTNRNPTETPPLLDTKVLPAGVIALFRNDQKIHADTNCTSVDHPETFVDWLVAAKRALSTTSDPDKERILGHLEVITGPWKLRNGPSPSLIAQLRHLPIYSRLACPPPFASHTYTKGSLDYDGYLYEVPKDLPPLPDLLGLTFFDARTPIERSMFDRLKAPEKVSARNLLNRHLLAWMESISSIVDDSGLSSVKYSLSGWLMKQAPSSHAEAWKSEVFSHPIIPLPMRGGERQYRRLTTMIDRDSRLAKLYSDEEERFPCQDFYSRHRKTLLAYGMASEPLWDTPLERVRHYSMAKSGKVNVQRIESLLKFSVRPELSAAKVSVTEIRDLRWLPGKSTTGEDILLAPNECRSADESDLIDYVLGTIVFSVKADWKKLLGWTLPIKIEILVSQLDECLSRKEHRKARQVLLHIDPEDYSELRSRSCLLGRSGIWLTPRDVVLPGSSLSSRSLAPYLDEIDIGFLIEQQRLVEGLGIPQRPSIEDLERVQEALLGSSVGPLSSVDLSIAISILEIATRLDYDPTSLLVPDTTSTLRTLGEIVHGDPFSMGDIPGFNFTHAEVSADLARRLRIENAQARAIRLELDIDSEEDDEFTPKESLTTSIKTTLSRYPITTTFNEYLANADDAKATKVIWILDECREGDYPSASLLTTDLQSFQGPALMVYNDGVFSKKDFAGFKDIGQGGKRDDPTSTGMFGRGALTMYHFTDVPMLVSDDLFLILDPQQQVLPMKYRKRRTRRVGTKMSLSAVSRLAPDQLSPFRGIQEFDSSSVTQFNGTIFRFPLRAAQQGPLSVLTAESIDHAAVKSLLMEYMATARTALLFLRHVKSIEFHVKGHRPPQWTVSADRSRLEDQNFQLVQVTTSQSNSKSYVDTWCVGLKEITEYPSDIVRSGNGRAKLAECGIAACLRSAFSSTPEHSTGDSLVTSTAMPIPEALAIPSIKQKIFCRLPTSENCWLPISIHASFGVTGDRKAIALEKNADNSAWNQWLLESILPGFYLDVLQYLTPRLGYKTFNFWPTKASKVTDNTICEVLYNAFWKKLIEEKDGLGDLLPQVAQDIHLDNEPVAVDLPASQKTTNLTEARFDFLMRPTSNKLQPLLMQIIPCLVRPPEHLWHEFKLAILSGQLKELNSYFLGELFQEEENCKLLEAFIAGLESRDAKESSMALLLEAMIPKAKAIDTNAWSVLNGCRVVPRPQLSYPLGTLIWKPQRSAVHNFYPTTEEQHLFAFAADTMVHTGLFPKRSGTLGLNNLVTSAHQDPLENLLDAPFNIRGLVIGDLGDLLGHPRSPIRSDGNPGLDPWLLKFWNYLNPKLRSIHSLRIVSSSTSGATIDDLLGDCGLHNRAVYRTRTNEQWQYMTPDQFRDEPCVLRPLNAEHLRICQEITDLIIIDRDCAPSLLRENEDDLAREASFSRFLRALTKLEQRRRLSVKSLVGALAPKSRDIIRDLALRYVSEDKSNWFNGMLLKLPIWPRLVHSDTLPKEHIAAEDARFCTFAPMLKPWVNDLARFVNPQVVSAHQEGLEKLNISLLSRENVWNLIKYDLPSEVKTMESRLQYRHFLGYLSQWNIRPSGRVAPNGASVMCETSLLYDHQETIFAAAFREQKTSRFLHVDMQVGTLRSFWLKLGLRSRSSANSISHTDFIECADAINRRWDPAFTSPSFTEDSSQVTGYLRFNKPEFQTWPTTAWARLAAIPMFRVCDISPGETFRRGRMQEIARQKTHCTLSDAGMIKYLRITWSQTRFLSEPPDDFVYHQLPRAGKPACTQVFENLKFLMTLIEDVRQEEIPEFLKDVQACYEYLQTEKNPKTVIPGIQEAKIWLNINTTQLENVLKQQLKPSLSSAKFLCLNSPVDPLPIKNTQKFLVPYETLLAALGCKSVVQPTSTSPPANSDSRELSLVAAIAEMRSLRDQNELVDVVFEAEGQTKPAHRIVLAAVSEYCKGQFRGEWGRVLLHNATVKLEDFRYLTLSQMIDFAYTGEFEWPELKDSNDNEEIASNLEMLLDLLDGTNMWLLGRLHEMTETFLTSLPYSAIYVRVDTVTSVKERAEEARAERLSKYCEEFLEGNRDFVVALRDEGGQE